jgi:asparagine synthase (glutamine-hydrolysing)
MFRYFAMLWDCANPAQAQAAQRLDQSLSTQDGGWVTALSSPGVRVLHAGARPPATQAVKLADQTGVILGTVFNRVNESDPLRPLNALSDAESRATVASGGRHLIGAYWGRYVAFVIDEKRRTTWVMRDPIGDLDCLSTSYEGVRLYFSNLSDCPWQCARELSINWRYVRATVAFFFTEARETGFNEVSRVLRGERVELTPAGERRHLLWNPATIAASEQVTDSRDAQLQLRSVTQACIDGWAACYERILLSLSGGLDSSIVAGCLRRSPARPEVTCLNYYYNPGSGSDERRFARVVANRCDYRLIESEQDPHFRIDDVLTLQRHAAPTDAALAIGVRDGDRSVVAAEKSRARFTGFGGDQLFYQHSSQLACADHVRERGIRSSLLRLAMNTALRERNTIWAVLARALRDATRPSKEIVLGTWDTCQLLTEEARRQASDEHLFIHPWLDDCTHLPPGKYAQVTALTSNEGMYSPCARHGDPEDVAPLFSQPLIELCLRIPVYILSDGFMSRDLARRAFRAELPTEILERRSKGSTLDYPVLVIAQNRQFIRETLLNGLLVRERILDRKKLETALSDTPARDCGFPVEIFQCLATEAWLRQWSAVGHHAAAA